MAIDFRHLLNPPKPPPRPPLPMTRLVSATVTGGAQGVLRFDDGDTYVSKASDSGRLTFTIPYAASGGGDLTLTLDGYQDWSAHVALSAELTQPVQMVPKAPPLPPMLPMEQLARIRGAMWTVRWDGPMGPRPGQPSNVLAMDYYEQYGPADRRKMIETYKAPGYTHAVTGPMIDPGGYHGNWTPVTTINQTSWDHYLDAMQEWRDKGIIPIHFMSPDNWSLERCREELSPYYLQPRAQALLPIKVPHGWEPEKYGSSSRTWALWGDWAAEVSAPGALILIHTPCDQDAPVGVDARHNDNTNPGGNGDGWKYVAPHFHGWLIQLCGFGDAMTERDPAKKAAALAAWPANLAAYFRDGDRRFRHGEKGWPTGSKFGPAVSLKLYLGECSSFAFFNDGAVTEDTARSFGDIAMGAGADGYLDGGSVSVA